MIIHSTNVVLIVYRAWDGACKSLEGRNTFPHLSVL